MNNKNKIIGAFDLSVGVVDIATAIVKLVYGEIAWAATLGCLGCMLIMIGIFYIRKEW